MRVPGKPLGFLAASTIEYHPARPEAHRSTVLAGQKLPQLAAAEARIAGEGEPTPQVTTWCEGHSTRAARAPPAASHQLRHRRARDAHEQPRALQPNPSPRPRGPARTRSPRGRVQYFRDGPHSRIPQCTHRPIGIVREQEHRRGIVESVEHGEDARELGVRRRAELGSFGT